MTAPPPAPSSNGSGEGDQHGSLIDLLRDGTQPLSDKHHRDGIPTPSLDWFQPSQPQSPDPLLTADDVAQILGVPRTYVYALARRGELPTVRIGERYVRFRRKALEQWIERCETTDRRGTQ